jgi:hypothetical protein
MRFCGLGPGDAVPDENTLWDFREALIAAGTLDALFAQLDRAITEGGHLPMAGQIVDATLEAAPRRRNTDAEKARIKAGETAADIWRKSSPAPSSSTPTIIAWRATANAGISGSDIRDMMLEAVGPASAAFGRRIP